MSKKNKGTKNNNSNEVGGMQVKQETQMEDNTKRKGEAKNSTSKNCK